MKKEGVRPASNGGSHHTSVKGEPGSALESNASAGLKMKTGYLTAGEPF